MPRVEKDIAHAVAEYAQSARLAIEAGFDGVELHAANGYLIEQFLNPNVNQRTDGYGVTIEGRNRFALEVAHATVAAIGADRAGIRLSPYAAFNSTGGYPDVEAQTIALVKELPALPRQPRSGRAHAQQRCTERTGHGDVLYPWRQGLHRLSNTHRMNSNCFSPAGSAGRISTSNVSATPSYARVICRLPSA